MTGLSRRDEKVQQRQGIGRRDVRRIVGECLPVRSRRSAGIARTRAQLISARRRGQLERPQSSAHCADSSVSSHVKQSAPLLPPQNGPRQGCEGGLRLQPSWRHRFRNQPCDPRRAGAPAPVPLNFQANALCSQRSFSGLSCKRAKTSSPRTLLPLAPPTSSSTALPSFLRPRYIHGRLSCSMLFLFPMPHSPPSHLLLRTRTAILAFLRHRETPRLQRTRFPRSRLSRHGEVQ